MVDVARLDLLVREDEGGIYRITLRIAGLDLGTSLPSLNVYEALDTTGVPLVVFSTVTDASADGLHTVFVGTTSGTPLYDVSLQLSTAAIDALVQPGTTPRFGYALRIAGDALATGWLTPVASDVEPPLTGIAIAVGPDGAVTVTYGAAEDLGPLVERAEQAAIDAAAAAALAVAARDAALATGQLFASVADGIAGSADGAYFSVAGDGPVALALYRRVGDEAVVEARIADLSALSTYGLVTAVTADVTEDQSATLNAALLDPAATRILLPPGVIWVDYTVRVPAGKSLVLRSDTVLRALPTFTIAEGRNHIVLLEGDGAAIFGGTVDAAKVGLGGASTDRINGITVLNGARGCIREDVRIGNCTGYAVYDSGNEDFSAPPASNNRRLTTFNAQIHLEAQAADGTVYQDCIQEDGDGDIPCLSWVHPLLGSRNISYRGCRGSGTTPAGWDVAANIAPLDNITIEDCHYSLVNEGSVAFAVPAGNLALRGLKVSRSTFSAPGGIGALLFNVEGSFVQTAFSGATAMEVTAGDIECTGCTAIGQRPVAGTAAAIGVKSSNATIRWNGGGISVSGPPSSRTVRGDVRLSAMVQLSPAPVATRPGIAQEAVGQVTPQVDGRNTYANLFPAVNVADIGKVHIAIAVRRLTPGYAATAIPQPTWSMIEPNFFRVYFAGIALSPADYAISYHFVECG